MKKMLIGAALATLVIAAPAQAHKMHHGSGHHMGHHMSHHMANAMGGGHPATVRLDGVDVPVCMTKDQDKCVNPREAGLNFGNRATDTYRPH